jgi:hypothetical protein
MASETKLILVLLYALRYEKVNNNLSEYEKILQQFGIDTSVVRF